MLGMLFGTSKIMIKKFGDSCIKFLELAAGGRGGVCVCVCT